MGIEFCYRFQRVGLIILNCVEARGRAQYFGGRPTAVELVADRNTGEMLGGAVIGEQDVAGRINVALLR